MVLYIEVCKDVQKKAEQLHSSTSAGVLALHLALTIVVTTFSHEHQHN
jgi:hypothetical protein